MLGIQKEFTSACSQLENPVTQEWLDDFSRRSKATRYRNSRAFKRVHQSTLFWCVWLAVAAFSMPGWWGCALIPFFFLLFRRFVVGMGVYVRQMSEREAELQALKPVSSRDRMALLNAARYSPSIERYLQNVASSERFETQGEFDMLMSEMARQDEVHPARQDYSHFSPYHPPYTPEHIEWARQERSSFLYQMYKDYEWCFMKFVVAAASAFLGFYLWILFGIGQISILLGEDAASAGNVTMKIMLLTFLVWQLCELARRIALLAVRMRQSGAKMDLSDYVGDPNRVDFELKKLWARPVTNYLLSVRSLQRPLLARELQMLSESKQR